MPPTQKRIRAVDAALAKCHGEKPPREPSDPVDGLVGTILSQNTTDLNSQAAFASLKQRFPTWEQARRARTSTIAKAIERGGLANIKAERIKIILNQIHAARGELSLDFLDDLSMTEAAAYLQSFHGVGPKTAACVLIFNCGRPLFPVDTHVFRVGGQEHPGERPRAAPARRPGRHRLPAPHEHGGPRPPPLPAQQPQMPRLPSAAVSQVFPRSCPR